MSSGLKIVTPGHNIHDRTPGNIVIDSRLPGSLKVHQVVRFKVSASDNTRTNGSGTVVGTKIISHDLGYSPAFICFRWGGGGSYLSSGVSITLPGQGELGETVPEQGYSNSKNVVVTGYNAAGAQSDVITVIIFRETLD